MKINVKEVVKYGGHSLKANGSVDLVLKAEYSELVNTIKVTQMLNNDVSIKAKVNGKPTNLGIFRIKSININGDGESKLAFNGLSDFVEMDNLNTLPLNTETVSSFQVMFNCSVDLEED